MKLNKIKYIILILSAIFLLYFCNYSKYRRYKFFLDPVYSTCKTIAESKEVGVFIEQYIPEKEKYKILNQTIEINDVWIEYCWLPSKYYYIPDTIYKDCRKLVFNCKEEIKNYDKENGFFIDNPYQYNIGIHQIVTSSINGFSFANLGDYLEIDTVILPIYKGEFKINKDNYEKLAELKFIRKKK